MMLSDTRGDYASTPVMLYLYVKMQLLLTSKLWTPVPPALCNPPHMEYGDPQCGVKDPCGQSMVDAHAHKRTFRENHFR